MQSDIQVFNRGERVVFVAAKGADVIEVALDAYQMGDFFRQIWSAMKTLSEDTTVYHVNTTKAH